MSTYNPSRRKNPRIKIRQIQQGILEYKDEIGKILIGIETRELNHWGLSPNDILKPHELCGAQWGVSSGDWKVGDQIQLCPRDIGIFKELIKYLEAQGIIIGDDIKRKRSRRKIK